jgi:hypothetical protein
LYGDKLFTEKGSMIVNNQLKESKNINLQCQADYTEDLQLLSDMRNFPERFLEVTKNDWSL